MEEGTLDKNSLEEEERQEAQVTISGDNPIRHPEDDTLGRTAVAESFARQVLALDTTEGLG